MEHGHDSDDEGGRGDTAVNGHGYSPALRDAERELAVLQERGKGLAGLGKDELDGMMGAGNAQLAHAGEPGADAHSLTCGALQCFAASYVMARALNYVRGEVDALNSAAICYRQIGKPQVALRMLEGCAELCARHGDEQGRAHALGNVALALRSLGRWPEAAAKQAECIRAAEACADVPCAVRAHVNLANMCLAPAVAPAAAAAAAAAGNEGEEGSEDVTHAPAAARHAFHPDSERAREHLRAAARLLERTPATPVDTASADEAEEEEEMCALRAQVCLRLASALEPLGEASRDEVIALYQQALEALAVAAAAAAASHSAASPAPLPVGTGAEPARAPAAVGQGSSQSAPEGRRPSVQDAHNARMAEGIRRRLAELRDSSVADAVHD